MSAGQMPPWLQEQIGKLQQSQQNLQSIMTQRQLEMEKAETEKALDELKVADGDSVFASWTVLIKSDKKTLDELEEKIELAKLINCSWKTEVRKRNSEEQEAKITEMMKSGNAPPPPTTEDNPRK